MCSIFSVCSTRCSVAMMSMISCNLLLASFGASSSTEKFHPLGVLSNGMTLPVSILNANARSGPEQTHCPCCVIGLTAIKGLLTSACREMCIFGLVPQNRLASRRVLYSCLRVPMISVSSRCWMPCRRHCPARCRVDSKRELSASFV